MTRLFRIGVYKNSEGQIYCDVYAKTYESALAHQENEMLTNMLFYPSSMIIESDVDIYEDRDLFHQICIL
jgi:hypothetical protein